VRAVSAERRPTKTVGDQLLDVRPAVLRRRQARISASAVASPSLSSTRCRGFAPGSSMTTSPMTSPAGIPGSPITAGCRACGVGQRPRAHVEQLISHGFGRSPSKARAPGEAVSAQTSAHLPTATDCQTFTTARQHPLGGGPCAIPVITVRRSEPEGACVAGAWHVEPVFCEHLFGSG